MIPSNEGDPERVDIDQPDDIPYEVWKEIWEDVEFAAIDHAYEQLNKE